MSVDQWHRQARERHAVPGKGGDGSGRYRYIQMQRWKPCLSLCGEREITGAEAPSNPIFDHTIFLSEGLSLLYVLMMRARSPLI